MAEKKVRPLKYKRVPYPENINPAGQKADYYIEAAGVRVGFVRAEQAGRSSGTRSHWHAYDNDGVRVGWSSYSTFRRLKDDIEAYHLHVLIGSIDGTSSRLRVAGAVSAQLAKENDADRT